MFIASTEESVLLMSSSVEDEQSGDMIQLITLPLKEMDMAMEHMLLVCMESAVPYLIEQMSSKH